MSDNATNGYDIEPHIAEVYAQAEPAYPGIQARDLLGEKTLNYWRDAR